VVGRLVEEEGVEEEEAPTAPPAAAGVWNISIGFGWLS
jgi:hypothetical protein